MTAHKEKDLSEERITLDQIVHRAEEIKDQAVTETKTAVAAVVDTDATRTLLVVAGVVIVAASLAFYLGSRGARRTFDEL